SRRRHTITKRHWSSDMCSSDLGAKVLIVDDFMKGGGTLTGMEELVKEFEGTIAGICVLCEADFDKEKLVKNYLSLVKISKIDTRSEEHTSELQSRFDLVCRLLL